MPILTVAEVSRVGREMYERVGASPEEAATVVDLLVESNLAGHDSHGARRLVQYVEAVHSGQIVPGAKAEVEEETAATASFNAEVTTGSAEITSASRI